MFNVVPLLRGTTPIRKGRRVISSLPRCWCLIMNEQWIDRETRSITGLAFLAKMELTGAGITFLLKTNKTNPYKIHENFGFQETRHEAMKDRDPWKIGNKWGEPQDSVDLLPFQVLGHGTRRGNPSRAQQTSLSWGEGTWSLGRLRHLEFQVRVPQKRATHKKRELPSSAEGSLHIQPSYDQLNLILRKLPKAGRKKKKKTIQKD